MKILLENICKKYRDHDVDALKNIDAAIASGEFVAIRGPSGCGKSTLLNIIGLIDRPSQGKMLFDDEVITAMSEEQLTTMRAARIGFVFQFFNLLSTLTVEENIGLPLQIRGSVGREEIRTRTARLMERFSINHRARFYPSQLSGGEMQRTAIARAVINAPQVLVADEPTGNLDSENGRIILNLLRELNEEMSQTIVMATHSEEASSYAKRVIEMRDGRIIERHGD